MMGMVEVVFRKEKKMEREDGWWRIEGE